jgi:hypothetical protein
MEARQVGEEEEKESVCYIAARRMKESLAAVGHAEVKLIIHVKDGWRCREGCDGSDGVIKGIERDRSGVLSLA